MPGIADGGLDAIGRWDRKAGAVEVWVHRPQAEGPYNRSAMSAPRSPVARAPILGEHVDSARKRPRRLRQELRSRGLRGPRKSGWKVLRSFRNVHLDDQRLSIR